jgi:hypothetical protein
MFWHISLEVVFAFVIAIASSSFWACAKSPGHLRKLLCDPIELARIVEFLGLEKLRTEAEDIRPLSEGLTYGDTINLWDIAHRKSLAKPRNALFVLVLVIIGASGLWLGLWYAIGNLLIFVLLGLTEIPAPAKNNNARHLPSVVMNLLKWRNEDSAACAQFCESERPEYRTLYLLLDSLEPKH